ncbi:hypothetical protein PUN28_011791 [Cardiocondyla obscurior]|uniref:Uncharacterized protein n=1 Tax=Cardiocondyla obscurior TaxID=286306 RepID=A0AAW2FKQ9_9HYME
MTAIRLLNSQTFRFIVPRSRDFSEYVDNAGCVLRDTRTIIMNDSIAPEFFRQSFSNVRSRIRRSEMHTLTDELSSPVSRKSDTRIATCPWRWMHLLIKNILPVLDRL